MLGGQVQSIVLARPGVITLVITHESQRATKKCPGQIGLAGASLIDQQIRKANAASNRYWFNCSSITSLLARVPKAPHSP